MTSCKKSQHSEIPISNKYCLINKINGYTPSPYFAKMIFNSFYNEVDNVKAFGNKSVSVAMDRTLDEAIWVVSALINRNYGFINDSIEYLVIDTAYQTLPIEYFAENGLPLINGQDIINQYLEFENRIVSNQASGFNFWSLALIVKDFDLNHVQLMSIFAGGPRNNVRFLITPLSPGSNMPLFDQNEWLWAGQSPDINIYHPQYMRANYRYFEKFSSGSPHYFDPSYVYTYYYPLYISAYPVGGTPELRIFWNYGMCGQFKMFGPILNQYLLSTKEVIDETNPLYNGNPDLVIGWFYIYCWDVQCFNWPCPNPVNPYGTQSWFSHRYVAQIYRRTYIGFPD